MGCYELFRKYWSFFADGCLAVGHNARIAPSIRSAIC